MGEDPPNIDNRYSPIYQRGGTGTPTTPGNHRTSHGEPQRQQQRPVAPSEAPAHPSPEEEANVVEVTPQDGGHPGSAAPAGRRINPFVLVLWLLGAALLALGLWAVFAPLQVDETAINGPYPQWIFIISQSAGGIVVSGSILLAAAGALSAIFWDRRRR